MGVPDEYRPKLFRPETWPIDDDEAYDVLSAQRRRFVIGCLHKHERSLTLADLADELATSEYDTSLTDIPAEEVKRIYLDLYHRHIPRLEEAGLVEYQQDTDTVVLTTLAKDFLSD